MSICTSCGEDKELRPYGKDFALICFDCAMKPDMKQIVEKNFDALFLNAVQNSTGVVVLGEETGPRPLVAKTLQ